MSSNPSLRRLTTLISALFFFSGASALVYQVVWMRELSLFFGSDVYATAITLSAFMAGLSLGSWLGKKFVRRARRPLLWYGVIEIGIGLYALGFGAMLHAFMPALAAAYRTDGDTLPLTYQLLRFGLAAAVLVPPTTLMGATLPLIMQSFVEKDDELGRYGGNFYAINTLGALVGTLGSAFVLIPSLGIDRTSHIAVAINIIVGLAVAAASRLWHAPLSAAPGAVADAPVHPNFNPAAARAATIAIAISGLAALAMEVVWTRTLTLSFSGTVYSFAIMLASFLAGIFQGSRVTGRTVDALANPVQRFGHVQFALATWVAVLALVSAFIPKLTGLFVWGLTNVLGGNFAAGSILAQLILGGALILGPTFLLGATFPLAVRICAPNAQAAGSSTGGVYAANTAGAIFGSLLAGFVLVPAFGSRGALVALALVFAANGLFLLRHAGTRRVLDARAVLSLGVIVVAGLIAVLLPHQTVANYGLQKTTHPDVIYHGEGISHAVDIVKADNGDVIMMVDGNTEADTSFIQRRHFILKAHLPLLLHEAPRDVAVVGLGLGITLSATARNPETQHIQLIELTPEMVRAHSHLEDLTGAVLKNPKLRVRIDDGRNFLSLTDRTFDMITADPIHPRISGVGYLYSEDNYRAIKRRLKPGGTVCQWMPMYCISRESFDVAFRSFARVFENASFWYVRGHGLFIATEKPFTIDYARFKTRAADPIVAKDLDSIEIPSGDELLAHLLMGPKQVAAYLASTPDQTVNTDDNARLEYDTPFEFLHKTKDIVAALEPFAGYDDSTLANASDDDRARVRAAWDARRKKLLSELDEPLR